MFSYNAISVKKESETLRLMLANGISQLLVYYNTIPCFHLLRSPLKSGLPLIIRSFGELLP